MTIENEELDIDEVSNETEAFITYDIASYPSDLTLSVLVEMWKNEDIVIPDFQRNFVWDINQSSLLIESFLLGLPVPQVFFYVDEENKNLVIDGQQRLLSVVYYLTGHFGTESIHGKQQVFRLSGLDERSPFANRRFVDLDEPSQRKLKSAVLRAINIRQLNPKEEHTSIYHIFERLNTGGTPLKPQEIRNCVFRGEMVKVLRELNSDKNWRLILGKKTLDKHQKDVELILRIFALAQNWGEYEKPMKEYLNRALDVNKKGDTKRAKWFKDQFSRAAELIVKKLGEKPFHIRGPLNTSALDSVFCTILEHIDVIPSDLKDRYANLKGDKRFSDATFYGTSDVSVLHARFKVAKEYLIGK